MDEVAREIAGVIGHDGILRLLSNLGQIAQADGHLELREALVISRIRAALHDLDEPPAEDARPRPFPRQRFTRWATAERSTSETS